MSTIRINHLNFSYSKKVPLLTDINLQIQAGYIYGLLGKNGAGKTTLLKLISGLRFPQAGDISINNFSVKDRDPNFIQDVFYLAEELYLPPISPKRYIQIYRTFYPHFDKMQCEQHMQTFGIPSHHRLDKMSYGQKKKFLIAFGVATNTKLLIMDEPTNGLDIPSKSLFRKILSSTITEDRAYMISTHQIKDIELMLDKVIILDDHKIKLNDSIEHISRSLFFTANETQDDAKILYEENHTLRTHKILSNPHQQDSVLDIELLFNAIVSDNQNIINYLNQYSDE